MSLRHALVRLRRYISVPLVLTKGTCRTSNFTSCLYLLGDKTCFYQSNGGFYHLRKKHAWWGVIFAETAAEDASVNDLNSESSAAGHASIIGLQRIEDGSIVSNVHTVKWRIYIDNGRDLFLKGKVNEAEKYFLLASQEAKEGFGERDPHVASSLNNMAEFYRVQKAFDKAEPLYLEAIHILEEAFGPEDVRVGVALHNLGEFYLVHKKLDEAQKCYERALKIKGRVLGFEHTEYAETMYHLGTVMYLEGKEKDGEVLIRDSLRILKDGGLGQSAIFVKRMRFLSQMLLKSGLLREAEALQRKILHALEISKSWTLETVIAAEQLALTLHSCGDLLEAEELMEWCVCLYYNATERSTPAGVYIQEGTFCMKNTFRITRAISARSKAAGNNSLNIRVPMDNKNDTQMALITLLQSLSAIGLLEVSMYQIQDETMQTGRPATKSERALRECIALYREAGGYEISKERLILIQFQQRWWAGLRLDLDRDQIIHQMSLRHALVRLRRYVSVPLVFTKGTCRTSNFTSCLYLLGDKTCFYQSNAGFYDLRKKPAWWEVIFAGTAGLISGINLCIASAEDASVNDFNSENSAAGHASITGLHRIEDGSIVSNIHTVKWRIYTDNGRDFFLKGKVNEAEKYFLLASQEAKEGFGERDPHVASSLNNLAEFYRVQKAFDKAEPLYLEAIHILEEAFGPEDVRVGVALHNLGQFYLVQKKLDEAQKFYERAMKIKGRVLGFEHTEYAETLYHLGTVMYLEGKEKDGEVLIRDSLRILEDGGLGQSAIFVKRMRYLSQMLLKSGLLRDAEALQRKILHALEISKGWTLETVIAAEQLALTLQSCGDLLEAEELMERCLQTRKNILHEEHIQVAVSMLHLARLKMLYSSQLKKSNLSDARAALEKAKFFLEGSIRITRAILARSKAAGSNSLNIRVPMDSEKDTRMALITLLQSLSAIGLLEVSMYEIQDETMQTGRPATESERALRECIALYREQEIRSLLKHQDVKGEYLSCLKRLVSVLEDSQLRVTLKELKDEVKYIQNDISNTRNKTRS